MVTAQEWECGHLLNQSELNICSYEEYLKAEQERLDNQPITLVILHNLSDNAEPTMFVSEDDLVLALESWVQFRDAYCTVLRMHAGRGTIAPFVNNTCHTWLTKRHVTDLERLGSNPVKSREECHFPDMTQSQSDNVCAQEAAFQSEQQLNEAFDQAVLIVTSSINVEAAANTQFGSKFVNAHELWLISRNATCEMEGSLYEGGTIQPAIVSNCIATMNNTRIEYIKELAFRPRG